MGKQKFAARKKVKVPVIGTIGEGGKVTCAGPLPMPSKVADIFHANLILKWLNEHPKEFMRVLYDHRFQSSKPTKIPHEFKALYELGVATGDRQIQFDALWNVLLKNGVKRSLGTIRKMLTYSDLSISYNDFVGGLFDLKDGVDICAMCGSTGSGEPWQNAHLKTCPALFRKAVSA